MNYWKERKSYMESAGMLATLRMGRRGRGRGRGDKNIVFSVAGSERYHKLPLLAPLGGWQNPISAKRPSIPDREPGGPSAPSLILAGKWCLRGTAIWTLEMETFIVALPAPCTSLLIKEESDRPV